MPLRALSFLATGLVLGGCATVTQGLSESVAIATPGASGARCRATNGGSLDQTLTAPGVVVLRKSRAPITVSCTADERTVSRTFAPAYASAARIQTPGGYLADAMTGAMWEYPHVLVVPFDEATPGADRQPAR